MSPLRNHRGVLLALAGWLGVNLSALAHPVDAVAPPHPVVPTFERFHASSSQEADLVEGGMLLLTELNCISCHQAPGAWSDRLARAPAISLVDVGSRLSTAELARFIRDPQTHKPGTLMPRLFAEGGAADESVTAIAHYLASLRAAPSAAPFPAGRFDAGRTLYHEVGCIACHAPAADFTVTSARGAAFASPKIPSVPIALASSYNTEALAHFLQNPMAVRPSGRMPASELTDQEAADLAAYLKKERPQSPRSTAVAEQNDIGPRSPLIETGRRHFVAQSCHACHETGDSRRVPPSVKPLTALQADVPAGCLSATPRAGVPDFRLSELHRRALRLALATLRSNPEPVAITPALAVDHYMTRMNCYACHARDGKGGVEPARADYFGSKDEGSQSLGEMGYLPPSLDHTGRKLTKEWWGKLLWGEGGAVRPYLKTRMPTFGRENSEVIFPMWIEADQRTPPVTMDISGQRLHQRAHYGRILMGTNDGGLGCITCHGLKGLKPPGIAAIDLTATTQRLHPTYFKELLLNPQALQPGTRMPPMFADRSKADQEIEQLWTYLREIDQQRLPDGLLPLGLYELKPQAAGRPLILRTFLEGAGLQAVAVGFPTQQHLAFDAAEVRWALTWRGRFLDAMSTWEERAMTPAKPLGDNIQSLPLWMPLARLATRSSPWPTTFGESAGYRYSGMSLDATGVPTFHYSVGTLDIEDTIHSGSAAGKMRRTLRLTGGGTGWYFRGLAPDASAVPVHFDRAGQATIEEELSW